MNVSRVLAALPLLLLLGSACDDDPTLFSSPFSEDEVRAIVASELCPTEPERVVDELIVAFDSGYWSVYVRASPLASEPHDIKGPEDYLALFFLTGGPDDAEVSSADERSRVYYDARSASCADTGLYSTQELERQIKESVKPGAKLSEIRAYLEAEDTYHGPLEQVSNYPQLVRHPEGSDLPGDTPLIEAVVYRPDGSALEFFFILDESMRLRQILALELGPPRP